MVKTAGEAQRVSVSTLARDIVGEVGMLVIVVALFVGVARVASLSPLRSARADL